MNNKVQARWGWRNDQVLWRIANKLLELNVGNTLTQIQEKLENLKLEDRNACSKSNHYTSSPRHQPDLNKSDRTLTCDENANHRYPEFCFCKQGTENENSWKCWWKRGPGPKQARKKLQNVWRPICDLYSIFQPVLHKCRWQWKPLLEGSC